MLSRVEIVRCHVILVEAEGYCESVLRRSLTADVVDYSTATI